MNSTVKMYGIDYTVRLKGNTVTIWSKLQGFTRDIPVDVWHDWLKHWLAENPSAVVVSAVSGKEYRYGKAHQAR